MTELQIFELIDKEVELLQTRYSLSESSNQVIRDRINYLHETKFTINELIKRHG